MRLVFCPENDCNVGLDDDDVDADNSKHDWRSHSQHFILGIAVKDTCVTAVYRETKSTPSSSNKKRKNGQLQNGESDQSAVKRLKEESSSTGASCTATTTTSAVSLATETMSSKPSKQQQVSKKDEAKKPAGYTFLTPSKSSQIRMDINSHLVSGHKGINDKSGSESITSNYMHTYLRIPRYISTLIVPTFTLDHPETNNNSLDMSKNGCDKNDVEKDKKHTSKKQPESANDNQMNQKQQQKKKKDVVPNSTKDSMPVDTPHGWQKIQPEQYWDAVLSLTNHVSLSSTATDTGAKPSTTPDASVYNSSCLGAVGLFDHMNISRDQINCMFAQFIKDTTTTNTNGEEGTNNALTEQAQRSIDGVVPKGKWETLVQKLVQRTNDWTYRIMSHREQSNSTNFWVPVHMSASHLPLDRMLARPRVSNERPPPLKCEHDVAIVGWDIVSYNREYRRKALRNLMTTLQSRSAIQKPKRRYMILAVNDIQSILDAAREGVSIIGTDMVRLWSRDGIALCLDITLDSSNGGKNDRIESIVGGKMDLSNEQYARDSLPLLPGCQCVSCRPRQVTTGIKHNNNTDMKKKPVPSFNRAYIHHLIKANEMLAETLLFVHNLHQMLLLFRHLSNAASLDEEERDEKRMRLDSLCQKIEEQIYMS
ncbi:queuine tRNA-ribosyltransferase family protein [bacterium]|nr:queuine tRNA-ribosyltransferase family protein [bacterium]